LSGVLALGETALGVALLALFLFRMGLPWRLGLDAASAGVALSATVSVVKTALQTHPASAFTEAFFVAGLPEEAIKLLGTAAFLRNHARARGLRDITLAAGALALGAAADENFVYIAQAGASWSITLERASAAAPHVLLGLAGGYVVARAPANARGFALCVAAWLGLAFLHGLYDFVAFATRPGAETPHAFDLAVAAFGLDRLTALWGLLTFALAGEALAAVATLRPSPERRGLGLALAAPLLAGAAAALIWGAQRAYAAADGNWVSYGTSLAIVLFAFGWMSLPPRRARELALVAAGTAALALAAALVWGPAGWTRLQVEHAAAQGAQFAYRRDFVRAVAAYDRALAIAPQDVAALTGRATAYLFGGRYADALADVDAGLRVAPSAALYGLRAEVDVSRRDFAAALADVDSAERFDGFLPDWLSLRAQVRLYVGDIKGARDDLDHARSLDARRLAVLRASAAYGVLTNDLDAAIRDLNQILHDNPQDSDDREFRGRVWFYKGEFAKARDDFAAAAPTTLFSALWLEMSQARLSEPAPEALRARLAAAPPDWPAPLARLLLGELTPEAARALARDDDQRCEADFFLAASRLGEDASDVSAGRLRIVRDECPKNFVQYEAAVALLKRLAL